MKSETKIIFHKEDYFVKENCTAFTSAFTMVYGSTDISIELFSKNSLYYWKIASESKAYFRFLNKLINEHDIT